jgi:hypothetical protein
MNKQTSQKIIEEDIIDEAFDWMFSHTYRKYKEDGNDTINMHSASIYEVRECLRKAIQKALALQQDKIIDTQMQKHFGNKLIKKEGEEE